MTRTLFLVIGLMLGNGCFQLATASESKNDIGCGEFSVQLICEFYGVDYDQNKARKILDPGTFHETSLARMKKCLTTFGLQAEGQKGSFDEVIKGQGYPLVVFVKRRSDDAVGHFAVAIYDSKNNALILFDRLLSDKSVVVDKQDFIKYWTGIVLVVKPPDANGHSMIWPVGVFILGSLALLLSLRNKKAKIPQPNLSPCVMLLFSCMLLGEYGFGAGCVFADTASVENKSNGSSPEQGPTKPIFTTQKSIDLGTLEKIVNERDFRVVFRWKNESNIQLRVSGVGKNCGCSKVEYDESLLQPGETTDFVTKTNLLGRYGNLAIKIAVRFEEDAIAPQIFACKLFRPMPPRVRPAAIDFGAVSEDKVSREFVVQSALKAGGKGVEILDGIRSSDSNVFCRVNKVNTILIRYASADKETANVNASFTASVEPKEASGPFKGFFTIPLKYNGNLVEISVPFRGHYSEKFVFRPSKVVAFIPATQEQKQLEAKLLCQGTNYDLNDIVVTCDNPNVSVTFDKETSKANRRWIGKLRIHIDAKRQKSFDAIVHLEGKSGKKRKLEFSTTLPITVRFIQD